MRPSTRLVAVLCALLMVIGLAATPVTAQRSTLRSFGGVLQHGRLVGQVLSLSRVKSTPTGFTLQSGTQTLDITVLPARTTFTARSAEADAEGLAPGDYAVVAVRRGVRGWIATKVDYDVQPFAPLKQFTGTLWRISSDARHISVRQDAGVVRTFTVTRQTRFRVDAHVVDVPPLLTRGVSIQVVAYRTEAGWLALFVDLRSTQLGLR